MKFKGSRSPAPLCALAAPVKRHDPRNALPTIIETPRLKLRAPIRGDVPALARLADNFAIYDVLARLPHPYTRADAMAFVEIVCQQATDRCYAITLENAFIGVVSFLYAEGEPPELGYWLGEPYWGRGFCTEAARALLEAAWRTGLYPIVGARALSANSRSRRVLEKLGFVLTGEGPAPAGHRAGEPCAFYRLEQPRWL